MQSIVSTCLTQLAKSWLVNIVIRHLNSLLSLSIVKGHLSNLPNCKTSRVDNIDNYLLNIASEVIAAPIRHF
jgi:hypothetical protein